MKPDPLLTTKLFIPRPRPAWVRRPRLLRWLDQNMHRALILVSAPAGYGKTTLLSQWIHERRLQHDQPAPFPSGDPRTSYAAKQSPDQQSPPISYCWLSLDESDNDPARFWTYFVAALQSRQANLGEEALSLLTLQQSPAIPPEGIVTLLVNEIARIPADIGLVLNDYHVITSPPIHHALAFLLDHLPPQMHLVIASRADPPLPLSRLRAGGQLAELRETDLRFTLDEMAVFLEQALGLKLVQEDLAILERRIEGWAAGLHLATLALQHIVTRPGQTDPSTLIRGMTGSHHFILDYLVEEVLNQQPASVQSFLLQTSILEQLSGSLCEALTGVSDGQHTLVELETANLFLIALDDARHWYRYHHLFREFLRQRLSQSDPDKVPQLHRRAAAWFGQQGLIEQAISHALAAADFELAADLIATTGQSLLYSGEIVTLRGWLEQMPASIVNEHPLLSVIEAWSLVATGRRAQAEERLQATDAVLAGIAEDAKPPALSGQIAAVRSTIAASQRDVQNTILLSQKALDLLPAEEKAIRALVTWNLAFAYRLKGEPEASRQTYLEAIARNQAAGNHIIAILATIGLGNLQAVQCHLHQARHTYQQALQMAQTKEGRTLPVAAESHLGLVRLFYEWDDLEEANRHLQQGLLLCRHMENVDLQIPFQVLQSKIKLAIGDVDGALSDLQAAEELSLTHGIHRWAVDVADAQVVALLRQGDLESVDHIMQRQKLPVGQARALLAKSQSKAALNVLESLDQEGGLSGYPIDLVQVLLLKALAFQVDGKIDQAGQLLIQALDIAVTGDLIRTFVDEGQPMEALLNRISAQYSKPDYIRRLLSAFARPIKTDYLPRIHAAAGEPIEPLSERELQVLQLLARGYTNRQIADTLILAVGTVKRHNNNIFSKLQVRNRTEAVAMARELGLL